MVRSRRKSAIKWWRGYLVYAILGVFWFTIMGVWLALMVGSRATGTVISSNPIYAVFTLFLGHMEWPGGWATLLIVVEGALLVVLIWAARRRLIQRASRGDQSD